MALEKAPARHLMSRLTVFRGAAELIAAQDILEKVVELEPATMAAAISGQRARLAAYVLLQVALD